MAMGFFVTQGYVNNMVPFVVDNMVHNTMGMSDN